MRQRLVPLAAIAFAFLLCTAVAVAKDVFPQGIVVDSAMSGVYSGADRGGCCWLAPSAAFEALEPQGTNVAILLIAAPPYAVGAAGTAISVHIGNAAPFATQVRAGVQEIAVPLKARAPATSRVTVRISSKKSFVPAQRGIGVDTRRLTFLLEKVTFVDTVAGQRYVGGIDAAMQPAHRRLAAMSWAVVLLGGIAAFALTRREASWAWIAVLVTAPFDFPVPVAGTTITLPKTVLVGCAAALAFRREAWQAVRERESRVLLAAFALFIGSMCLSSVHAAYVSDALRETLKAAQYALTAAVAFCAYRISPRSQAVRTAACWSLLLVCALALSQEFTGTLESRMAFGHDFARIGGPLEGPNQLGAYLGLMLPLMMAFAFPGRLRALEILAACAGIATLFLTFSRGGVLAGAFAIAIMLALRLRPARSAVTVWSAAAVWGLLAAGVILALSGASGLSAALGSPDAYNSGLGTRAGLWHAAIHFWRSSPLLGIGPGNFEVVVGSIIPGVRTHPNNYYLQMLAEQGIVGLTAFLALNAALLWAALRSARTAAGAAALAAVFGIGLHQLLDGLLLYPKVGVVFFTIAAIGVAEAALQSRTSAVPETVNARTALAL